MTIELDEKDHGAGVTSKIHSHYIVSEPITIIVDGEKKPISLDDAKWFLGALSEAVARVEESEHRILQKTDGVGHAPSIGRTENGMSWPRSRFGDRPFLFGGKIVPAQK